MVSRNMFTGVSDALTSSVEAGQVIPEVFSVCDVF